MTITEIALGILLAEVIMLATRSGLHWYANRQRGKAIVKFHHRRREGTYGLDD